MEGRIKIISTRKELITLLIWGKSDDSKPRS